MKKPIAMLFYREPLCIPIKNKLFLLCLEAIQNTDGSKKQDCETNAAKRFIDRLKATHPRQKFLICGDGLMSHQPLIEKVLDNNMHYIFVCKPGDHQYLFEWLNDFLNCLAWK
ncbi:MAG: hypothetical protein Q9M92_01965 [Enterobacterales bacterium]|nr:hypothetical protein [Enterobacterales bacterium]